MSIDDRGLWWRLAVLIYIPSITLAIARGILILIIPLYVSKIIGSYTVIGIATAGISIGMLIFDIPSGYIISRVGVNLSGLLVFLLLTLSVIGLYLSSTIVEIILSLILFGFGFGLWFILRHYILTTEVIFKYRGRASALLGLSMRLGFFIGPIVGGAISTYYGYRESFLAVLLLVIVSTVIFTSSAIYRALYRNNDLNSKNDNKYNSSGRKHYIDSSDENKSLYNADSLAGIKSFIFIMFILLFLIQVIRYGRFFIIPIYGRAVLGLDDLVIGFSMGIAGFLDALVAYPSGVIMDKIGRGTSIFLSFSVMGIGLLMLSYTYSDLLYILAVSIIGLGHGLGSGTMLTLGSDIGSLLDKKASSKFLGYWHFISDLGDTLGPISMGGLASIASLDISALILGAISIIVALASYHISFKIESYVRKVSYT